MFCGHRNRERLSEEKGMQTGFDLMDGRLVYTLKNAKKDHMHYSSLKLDEEVTGVLVSDAFISQAKADAHSWTRPPL